MMGGMGGPLASMLDNKQQASNPLTISWVDSSWVPILNSQNVMEYFSDRRNPFYDAQCNNEVLKMQRASLDQLANMTGIEFCLLYVQDPILYVIRKQHRNSPTQTTPIADYYIVAGTIYQAPDLSSVVNSRLLAAVSHLQSAFEEARSYVKYHPAKGYTWDFQQNSNNTPYGAKKVPPPGAAAASNSADNDSKKVKKAKKKSDNDLGKEESVTAFQRIRVHALLNLLQEKFPPPQILKKAVPTPAPSAGGGAGIPPPSPADIKSEKGAEESVKSEKISEPEQSRGIKREAVPTKSGDSQPKKTKYS